MGQYLKDAYEERDLAKTLAKVHGIIDEETQKLSDKVRKLKLSHNRMRSLLKMSKNFVESLRMYNCPADLWKSAEYLHERLTLELYGLGGYQGLKGGKK